MKEFLTSACNRVLKIYSRSAIDRFITSEISKIPRDSLVLSVGAGGTFGRSLRNISEANGWTLLEIDIDKNRQPDLVGDICDVKLDQKFHAIVALEVFEHVKSPGEAFENCLFHLRDGGKIFGSTPFLFPIHDEPHDFFRFTEYGLRYLMREYDKICVRPRSGFFVMFGTVAARLWRSDSRGLRVISLPLMLFLYILWPFAVFLDRMLVSRFAPSGYLFTAEKKNDQG